MPRANITPQHLADYYAEQRLWRRYVVTCIPQDVAKWQVEQSLSDQGLTFSSLHYVRINRKFAGQVYFSSPDLICQEYIRISDSVCRIELVE